MTRHEAELRLRAFLPYSDSLRPVRPIERKAALGMLRLLAWIDESAGIVPVRPDQGEDVNGTKTD